MVRLIPPAYVKPFVKRQKNDAADAEAICEAAQRPSMRFVAVKDEEQQANGVVFRARDVLVRQRTQCINALRGQLTEYGWVVPKGTAHVATLMTRSKTQTAPCRKAPPRDLQGHGQQSDVAGGERCGPRQRDQPPVQRGSGGSSIDDDTRGRSDHRHSDPRAGASAARPRSRRCSARRPRIATKASASSTSAKPVRNAVNSAHAPLTLMHVLSTRHDPVHGLSYFLIRCSSRVCQHPAEQGRVIDYDAAIGEHGGEVVVGERGSQIPPQRR